MKLIKINEEYYVVKNNDGVITHSTQPLEIIYTPGLTMTNPPIGFINIMELSLEEVKELIGEVDVEKMAKENYVEPLNKQGEKRAQLVGNGGLFGFNKFKKAFKKGYNQAIEDNKEKKYTKEDMRKAWNAAYIDAMSIDEETYKPLFFEDFIESLRSKTEWEVEIINGKLTIL